MAVPGAAGFTPSAHTFSWPDRVTALSIADLRIRVAIVVPTPFFAMFSHIHVIKRTQSCDSQKNADYRFEKVRSEGPHVANI